MDKIDSIHVNMHFEVNEKGHIFLINRLSNTLYYFYECLGEHKLLKLKLEPEFVLESADSSDKYLVLHGKEKLAEYRTTHRYRVFDISNVIESQDHRSSFTKNDLKVVFDSKSYENRDVKKDGTDVN